MARYRRPDDVRIRDLDDPAPIEASRTGARRLLRR
jgi:hypothetical protein